LGSSFWLLRRIDILEKKRGRPKTVGSKSRLFKFRLNDKEYGRLSILAEEKCMSKSELVRYWINKNWEST
jgi:predicted DNA-binding protein